MRSPVLACLVLVGLFGAPVQAAQAANDYIVVLHNGARAAGQLARQHGLPVRHVFAHALRGFATRLTAAEYGRLAADDRVAAIEPDLYEQVLEPSVASAALRPAEYQSNPRHVDDSLRRVGADAAEPRFQDGLDDERPDVDVAILDSGIAPLADLNIAGGYNCTGSARSAYGDVYGHGTEVAAVAAALDNDDGIVGLLPGARVWAVKMITDGGSLSTSMTLCALDWVTGQRDPADPARPLIEVANMSFTQSSGAGSPVDDGNCGATSGDRLHQAICRMTAAGTIAVAAAGNHSRPVGSRRPAAFREVIAVSALADFDGQDGRLAAFDEGCLPEDRDADDTFADFSNYGPAIDVIAPGVCLTMPWIRTGGNLHQQSGTSFASPLVAATVALYRLRYPDATPSQVRHAVLEAATGTWATSTDPDGQPDRLLRLANLRPPDTVPPVAAFGRIAFATGRRSAASSAALAIGLRVEDERSASYGYQLQRSVGTAEWTTVARGSGATAIATTPLAQAVRFRLRATDEAGNVGAWVETTPLVVRLVDSSAKALSYGAGWSTVAQSTAFGGSVRRTSTRSSQVGLVFEARAVAVVATAGPDRGRGRLTVGADQQTFDTLRSTTQTRRVVSGMAWSAVEQRQVTVTALGTPGRPRLEFDALLVLTTP